MLVFLVVGIVVVVVFWVVVVVVFVFLVTLTVVFGCWDGCGGGCHLERGRSKRHAAKPQSLNGRSQLEKR